MVSSAESVVRAARPGDVVAIRRFGEAHIPALRLADRRCRSMANERVGAFDERHGCTVDTVEASSSGDPALGVVWRARPLTARPS